MRFRSKAYLRFFLLAFLAAALLSAGGCSLIVEHKAIRYIRYNVVAGDSLKTIATRFNVSVIEVFEINNLREPIKLSVGQALRIPYRGQQLRQEDQSTLKETLVEKPAASESAIRRVSLSSARQYVGKLLWPLASEGKVSSKFGRRWFSFHEGIDIAEELGTPVLAAHDGTVVYSDNGFRGYGNLVVVKGEGILTVYGHNRRNRARLGQKVRRGDHIADLGNTGKSSGPHLHFETRIRDDSNRNVAVDPMAFFK